MSIHNRAGAARPAVRGAGVQPIRIVRQREIASSADRIFALLAEPSNLARLLPNVRSVELLDQTAEHARVITTMSLGPLAGFRVEGTVHWQPGREIVFRARAPLAVESRWLLIPVGSGTRVEVTLVLDLASVIGPLAAFVPADKVIAVIAPDMDATLAKIAAEVTA